MWTNPPISSCENHQVLFQGSTRTPKASQFVVAFDSSQTCCPPGDRQQLNLKMPSHPHAPPTQHLQESQLGIFSLHPWGAKEAEFVVGTGPHLGKIAHSCASVIEIPRTKRGPGRRSLPLSATQHTHCPVGRGVRPGKADPGRTP